MREEWKEDSEGKKGLDRERFDWCWFELADMWTSSMEAEEYAEFLHTVLRLMTTTKSVRREDGTIRQQVVWRDDREVMPNPNPNPNTNPNPNPSPNPSPNPNRCYSARERQQLAAETRVQGQKPRFAQTLTLTLTLALTLTLTLTPTRRARAHLRASRVRGGRRVD